MRLSGARGGVVARGVLLAATVALTVAGLADASDVCRQQQLSLDVCRLGSNSSNRSSKSTQAPTTQKPTASSTRAPNNSSDSSKSGTRRRLRKVSPTNGTLIAPPATVDSTTVFVGLQIEVTSGAAVSGSQYSSHTAIADLNGDGKPDLYTSNHGQPNRLLLADGKGGFAEVTSGAAVSGRDNSHHTAIADLNGDGKPDLYT